MILQTNDTDHHEHVRKRFIELQTQRMIMKTRMQGGGMAELDMKENIDVVITVYERFESTFDSNRGVQENLHDESSER